MSEIANTDASMSSTNIAFSVGKPMNGASQSSRDVLKKDLSLVSPAEFFALIPHQLLRGVYLVGIAFDEFSVVFSQAEKAH